MRFLQTLFKKKRKELNEEVRRKYSNVPRSISEYVKQNGNLPLSMIKSYLDNTGQPIRERFPKKKATLFNVKPRL